VKVKEHRQKTERRSFSRVSFPLMDRSGAQIQADRRHMADRRLNSIEAEVLDVHEYEIKAVSH